MEIWMNCITLTNVTERDSIRAIPKSVFESFWTNPETILNLVHGEKKLLNQQMSSAGIGTAVFFCNFYRFFCWIHRLFVNSTDEPVNSTDISVRIADFKKKEKSVILTDISVDFTGLSVEFTNNLWIQQKNL